MDKITVLYLVTLGVAFVVAAVLFVLKGISISTMLKALGENKRWLAFVPVVSYFSLGKIAEKYVKREGVKSSKLSLILLVLNILNALLFAGFALCLVLAISLVINKANLAIEKNISMTVEMFYSFIPVVILYFLAISVGVTVFVVRNVAQWRIFSMYETENAVVYTVLSVIFPFLPAILLFLIRNKLPKFTYEERMGISTDSL